MKTLMLNTILIGLLILLVSCSRGKSDSSTVRIQFNGSISSQGASSSGKVVALSGDAPEWNQSLNPATSSDINCYAIFIGGNEPSMSKSRCYNSTTSETQFRFGPHLYFIEEGTAISVDVPSGSGRNIVVAGLKTQNGACKLDSVNDDEPDFANMSLPFILAQKKIDLSPGITNVSIDAKLDLNSYFDDCDFARDGDSGGGVAPPGPLQITGNYPFTFGTRANGGQTSNIFTVVNAGSSLVSSINDSVSLAPPYSYLGGTFPGTGGTCSNTLSPAGSCTIAVSFNPSVTGVYNDEIELNYQYEGKSEVSRMALVGSSNTPAILMFSASPTYDFGSVVVGNTPVLSFTITNIGGVDATAVVQLTLSTPYSLMGGTCTSMIPVGGSCTISVMFAPGSINSFPSVLQVSYNDGVSGGVPVSVNLFGAGI